MSGYEDEEKLPEELASTIRAAADSRRTAPGGTFPLRRMRYVPESRVPLESAGHDKGLTNLVDQIDPETKRQMIVQNLRIVVSIAKRYTNRGLDLVDLIRVGNMGLVHAMEKFEPEGGFCFSTFVTWCVEQQIELAIQNQEMVRRQLHAAVVPGDALEEIDPVRQRHWREHLIGCARASV